jgi:hypothetical protein
MATQAEIDANSSRYSAAERLANQYLAAGNTAAANEQHRIMQSAAESNAAMAPQVAATNDEWHKARGTGPYATATSTAGTGGTSAAPPPAFSASQIMENILYSALGIRGLGGWAADFYNRGASPTEIIQSLRYGTDTSDQGRAAYQSYLQAFPQMDVFIREGIFAGESPELQYISYRNTVKESAARYGIMDEMVTNDKIAGFIAGRNSAAEIADRMGQAAQAVATTPTETYAILQEYYGVNNGDLISFYLDPDATEAMLQRRYTAARIGTEAARQQFGINVSEAESLATRGVSVDEANQGFAVAAQRQGFMQGRGETASRQDVMGASFGDNEAATKVERIAQSRVGQFQQGGSFTQSERGVTGLGSAATR